ncbi:MAG: hypothetical protein U1F09_09920 [Steroidobacteraceae bacterium]
MNIKRALLVTTASTLFCAAAWGQSAPAAVPPAPAHTGMSGSLGLVVFPAKGQTPQVQSQDEGECYAWSKNHTGVDPMALANAATATTPAAQPQGGKVVGTAAKGAVAGTAIGAVAGNTGKGAAIGATAGALKGVNDTSKQAAQAQQQNAQAQQAAQAQAQARQQQLDTFKKGYSACLESKGYTVK